MKADKTIATYRRMRTQPLWRLIASNNGPTVIGLLQSHLYESDRSLPASIFHERIGRDLEELRSQGEDFPQTAQAYVASWLAEGYLERRFLPGAKEEEYELSTAAVEAIRYVSGLAKPHSAATESRLTLVIEALARLAEDTDTDKFRRIDRLMAEQARIDKEIDAIQKGQMRVLPHTKALERTREIISLADDLAGDFRRVRDQFDQLNRDLRERIMDNDGSRGDVLDSLFAGIDLITESEAGRTFSAFWRLLTDPEQAATLDQALDSVMSREFVTQLDAKDRRFLLRLTRTLLEQGGMVHEVLQSFARSLKHFVQSREYLEQRRLNQLLKDAQRAALVLKDEVILGNISYMDMCVTNAISGGDCSVWVYDLFRPYAPTYYQSTQVLTAEENGYLKQQRDLSFINLIDPFLIGINGFATPSGDCFWNANLRHELTPFGYTIAGNVFLHARDGLDIFGTLHLYRNDTGTYPGIDVTLPRYPVNAFGQSAHLTPRVAAWMQPENLLFRDTAAKAGGLMSVRLDIPIASGWNVYGELENKTPGWVAANEYLRNNFSVRVGLSLATEHQARWRTAAVKAAE